MPLLIADIGGSSSRWALAGNAGVSIIPGSLPGYNPSTGDPAALQQALRVLRVEPDEEPLQVMAYGAGCGHPARAARMHDALAAVWPGARVEVATDLLGAARSQYGTGTGLVLILGTGMHAGHYDGEQVHTPMPSLGFILGDEGSGADIGKQLLHDALHGLLPAPVSTAMFPQGPDLPAVLEAVYRSPAPQAFVASFTKALARHQSDPYVIGLLRARFSALARLLQRYFAIEGPMELRAVGSVAFGFRNLLAEALEHQQLTLTAAVQDPLPGLLAFHRQELR